MDGAAAHLHAAVKTVNTTAASGIVGLDFATFHVETSVIQEYASAIPNAHLVLCLVSTDHSIEHGKRGVQIRAPNIYAAAIKSSIIDDFAVFKRE